jgi:hypothetical protein
MNWNSGSRCWTKFALRFLRWILGLFVILCIGVTARSCYAFRDRNPGYTVAINIDGQAARKDARKLRVGFGRVKINPDLSDPKRPIWLAGFSQHRAATKIHDDLWAVACVIDDGHSTLGLVALDAIGFFHDDVISLRRQLPTELKFDYTVICSTHNHSTPDLLGLWGPNYARTGVNADYRRQVILAVVKALKDALAALQPARVAFHEIPTAPAGLVADTRKPEVFDSHIRLMHFTVPTNGATIGSIIAWADHPETVWGKNTEITADFPGYLRESLENGVRLGDAIVEPGLGGTHLYVNGAIGGLMSTTPNVTVRDPYTEHDFKAPTHDKARALGRQLASRILARLEATNVPPELFTVSSEHAPLSLQARTIEVPLDNPGFFLAPVIGLIDRGQVRWKRLRTEVAVITFGDASIACIPGEIYPEIVNGGVEKAPGGDFNIEPVEVPPLRQLMPGKIKFIFGLANDEIGYIIPKSEWDRKPPYLYGASRPVYGEINSVGPDVAEGIHKAIGELCRTNPELRTAQGEDKK